MSLVSYFNVVRVTLQHKPQNSRCLIKQQQPPLILTNAIPVASTLIHSREALIFVQHKLHLFFVILSFHHPFRNS